MALRTVALCNGKHIGIESVYTVINGRQINIPEKLEDLREKSRRGELFCPCGCGANLILVAGDKNLREQHFRIKEGTGNRLCRMPEESSTSVISRSILKYWMEEKLGTCDIGLDVPVTLTGSLRRPEFTLLSTEKGLAIRYWKTRENIQEEKLDFLEENSKEIRILYIVDSANGGTDGQYPEYLMKIQKRQGFCLLLTTNGAVYEEAVLSAVFYARNIDGFWEEIPIAEKRLNQVKICENQLFFSDKPIEQALETARKNFAVEQNKKLLHRERIKKQREEEEQRRLEQRKKAEEIRKAEEEKQRSPVEFLKLKKERQETEFIQKMAPLFLQQETQVIDPDGNRWIRCEFCGKTAKEGEFDSYGGINHVNLGICRECSKNNPAAYAEKKESPVIRKNHELPRCPRCGRLLRERTGTYGRFLGCSGYPACKYTEPIGRSTGRRQ